MRKFTVRYADGRERILEANMPGIAEAKAARLDRAERAGGTVVARVVSVRPLRVH